MRQHTEINEGWQFRRLDGVEGAGARAWRPVALPHTAVEASVDGAGHWQGLCEYRRELRALPAGPGWRQVLWVGAAMHTARVLLDGRELAVHEGGYLPFEVELGSLLDDGLGHELVLELDNRDNPEVPPGKPLADLDFCWYGGLYRGAAQRAYPPLHITDELSAGRAGGGGVFFRTLSADAASASCEVAVEVGAAEGERGPIRVLAELSRGGRTVASGEALLGGPGVARVGLAWGNPALWSVSSPALHELRVAVLGADGRVADERRLRAGVRRLGFSRSGGLTLNGERVRPRGTNRHQEYPVIGYSAGPAADRRDARRIKEAGFDYVRLSHYPQSPAFLDACDELGILVMNAIPGWQHMGGHRFQDACVRAARELVRRDRNHACVVLWELSLNETQMDADFMRRLHEAGHEEYPGDQMFTCGWMNAFDVYIHARQHGRIHSWRDGDRALVVSEYGDWEFYAANEGFDQKTGAGVHAAWSNSRHLRGEGEAALLQQAANFSLALNDTLSSPAVLDGQWCMFDYARGYHPQRAACGVSDIHRVPKFAWHFYRSQRGPAECGAGWSGGPVVFIASHWLPGSSRRVTVFSNCEQVELRLNGRLLGRERPSVTAHTQYLPHPPFVFDLPAWEPGELVATGLLAGSSACEHRVRTAGEPARLRLEVDTQGIAPGSLGADAVFVHAVVVDGQGQLCPTCTAEITLEAEGCDLAGASRVAAEAGLASALVRLPAGEAGALVRARCAFGAAEVRLR